MRCLVVLCCVLLSGCAHLPPSILVLDNHGGVSHAGRRLELHAGNTYTDTQYTDVVGDRHKTHGTYILNDQQTVLSLSPAQGEPERLYRAVFNGRQYWIHEQHKDRITAPAEDWLRQVSLKTQSNRSKSQLAR